MSGDDPEERRALALVIATATLVGFTLALTFPLLTIALERAGVTPFVIGINSAASGMGIFLIAPFVDRIVARFGPVACIRGALVACAVTMVLFGLRTDPWLWLPVRLVYGSAAALMFVLSEAAVNSLASDARRGRILGLYAACFSIGYAGGPLVLNLAGTEGSRPFVLGTILFLLVIVPTLWLGTLESRLRPEAPRSDHRRWMAIWALAPLPFACVFVYAFAEGAHFALLPLWALARGSDADGAALLVGIWLSGNILVQLPLGWLADRVRRETLVAVSSLISVVCLALLPLAAGHTAMLWPLLVVSGGVTGGLYTLGLVLLGTRFRGSDLTSANTGFVMTFQLGMIAGPPVGGGLIQLLGSVGFPLAIAPLLLALVVLATRHGGVARGLPVADTPR